MRASGSKFAMLSVLFATLGYGGAAHAFNEHWTKDGKIKVYRDRKGDCEASAHLKYDYRTLAGMDFFVVEVRLRTRVTGRGHRGRGHAVYTAYNDKNEPIYQVHVSKYASTGGSTQNTKDENKEVRFLVDKFWNDFAYDTFVVYAEDKDGELPPSDISKYDDWLKSRIEAVVDASKDWRMLSEDAKKEAENWFVRRATKP